MNCAEVQDSSSVTSSVAQGPKKKGNCQKKINIAQRRQQQETSVTQTRLLTRVYSLRHPEGSELIELLNMKSLSMLMTSCREGKGQGLSALHQPSVKAPVSDKQKLLYNFPQVFFLFPVVCGSFPYTIRHQTHVTFKTNQSCSLLEQDCTNTGQRTQSISGTLTIHERTSCARSIFKRTRMLCPKAFSYLTSGRIQVWRFDSKSFPILQSFHFTNQP